MPGNARTEADVTDAPARAGCAGGAVDHAGEFEIVDIPLCQ
jgi:hypothetical protein